MKQYLDLLQHILDNGVQKGDRTGTGTISTFGYQMRFNLSKGFPLITTKRMDGSRLKGIIYELLWFLKGDTNIQYLLDNGVNIWTPDAYREYRKKLHRTVVPMSMQEFSEAVMEVPVFAEINGDLGPVYGKQWRNWATYKYSSEYCQIFYENPIDQIAYVIEQIKTNPDSRRHLVSAWNPGQLDQMALPPCHYSFQFYVVNNKLSCLFNMRSTDTFLGLPFNIASYALLTMMVANVCDLELGELIYSGGDVHIYNNHLEQVKLQLSREPKPLPQMFIKKHNSIDDFKYEDFELVNYNSWPSIKGDVSV